VTGDDSTEEPQNTSWWGVARRTVKLLAENYAFIGSLLYLYATAIGIIYAAVFYSAFGINIFDHVEIGDFLLAGLRNYSVLLAVGWQVFVVYLTIVTVSYFLGQVSVITLGFQIGMVVLGIVFLCFTLFSFVLILWLQPLRTAEDIKQGEPGSGPPVAVRYSYSSGSTDQVTKTGLVQIGATQRVGFFHDVNDESKEKDNRTLVIPQSQIVSIEVPD
jgi:hypothetical protein